MSISQTPGSYWRSKRIVVTGGAGFLGSFLMEALQRRGAADAFSPRSRQYDLRRLDSVQKLLREFRPDLVIHLAAKVGGIGANRRRPAEFFYDNLMMGVQLLHECWRQEVEKFVAIGSVCSYPKHTPVPFREDDLWEGYPEETNAPYGLAKKMLLVQSEAYRQQHGYNSIFLLPVNLYGPRDNFDLETSHVIPALMRKCLEAKEQNRDQIVAWGSGKPTREFLYVEDAAEGILLASEHYNSSEAVNLGSGEEISIGDLTERIAALTGYEGGIRWDTAQPDGQPRRYLDTSRARQRFGFRARTPLDEGLQKTLDWYLANRSSEAVGELS